MVLSMISFYHAQTVWRKRSEFNFKIIKKEFLIKHIIVILIIMFVILENMVIK